MIKLELRFLGDPILRKKARPVVNVNKKIKDILDSMVRVMAERDGVGLAGPQVGISKRIVVVDVGNGPIKLINPEIVKSVGSEIAVEGCLSIPGVFGEVRRASEVEVTALDENGRRVWIEGSGLLARALQHELDHLDGILFVDKVIRFVSPGEGSGEALEATNATHRESNTCATEREAEGKRDDAETENGVHGQS
ncbi:MAG TPA: peptide deformylase [Clostridia bacterium]|nr:peptide deformylase [Clostridia bacterium]